MGGGKAEELQTRTLFKSRWAIEYFLGEEDLEKAPLLAPQA